MNRAERSAEAIHLRSQGLIYREIAERMGISISYAFDLIKDPDGVALRERRDSYGGTCESCGTPTHGSDGRAKAPSLCSYCSPRARTFWTSERIIEAIREYHARYGRVVSAMDWHPAFARKKAHPERLAEIERRWAEGCWPNPHTVTHLFGTWNQAIRAAGFKPMGPGQRRDPAAWREHRRRKVGA